VAEGQLTYVNGKLCAKVNRGVFEKSDGRFALSAEAMLLFGSNKDSTMPGLKVKLVEITVGTMTAEEVKENARKNRVYSAYAAEHEAQLKKMEKELSLQPLFAKPPPVWVHPAFLVRNMEAFLGNTGLDGGSIPMSISGLHLAFSRMLRSEKEMLMLCGFNEDQFKILNTIEHVFAEAAILSNKFNLAQKNGSNLVNFVTKKLKPSLDALKESEFLLIPGGFLAGNSFHEMVYIVEAMTSTTWRFVVISTQPLDGLQWHEVRKDLVVILPILHHDFSFTKIHI
jgi:hypothetical protein